MVQISESQAKVLRAARDGNLYIFPGEVPYAYIAIEGQRWPERVAGQTVSSLRLRGAISLGESPLDGVERRKIAAAIGAGIRHPGGVALYRMLITAHGDSWLSWWLNRRHYSDPSVTRVCPDDAECIAWHGEPSSGLMEGDSCECCGQLVTSKG